MDVVCSFVLVLGSNYSPCDFKNALEDKLILDRITFHIINQERKYVAHVRVFVHGKVQIGPIKCLRVNRNFLVTMFRALIKLTPNMFISG